MFLNPKAGAYGFLPTAFRLSAKRERTGAQNLNGAMTFPCILVIKLHTQNERESLKFVFILGDGIEKEKRRCRRMPEWTELDLWISHGKG